MNIWICLHVKKIKKNKKIEKAFYFSSKAFACAFYYKVRDKIKPLAVSFKSQEKGKLYILVCTSEKGLAPSSPKHAIK